MLRYVCKICGKSFEHHTKYGLHVKNDHGFGSIREYYDKYFKKENEGKCAVCEKETGFISVSKGYYETCSVSCARKLRNMAPKTEEFHLTCAICGEEITGVDEGAASNRLRKHLRDHHAITSIKEYYDKYLKKENEGICPICRKPTEFKSINVGYFKYCSSECSAEATKRNEDSEYSKRQEKKKKAGIFQKIINGIKEKYQKFISGGDKMATYSDVRQDKMDVKTITKEEVFDNPDKPDKPITVKTEITYVSNPGWVGTQTEFAPRIESCTMNSQKRRKYNNYYDIDDDQGFSCNEWC